MIMKLYTMRDKKSGLCSAPFAAPNDGVAFRMVLESLRDRDAMISKYPADFQVLFLGEYAEDDGSLSPAKDVRVIVEVSALAESLKVN